MFINAVFSSDVALIVMLINHMNATACASPFAIEITASKYAAELLAYC
jgi:hypothetical protein